MTQLTKDEAIVEACDIVALAYRSIGDFTRPSDGFCPRCDKNRGPQWRFENDGEALAFVRQAVVEKLQRDGYGISPDFPAPAYSALPGRTT